MAIENFGELFSDTVKGYREHFSLFLKIGISVYFIPSFLLSLIVLFLPTTSPFAAAGGLSISDVLFSSIISVIQLVFGWIIKLLFIIAIIKALTLRRAQGDVTFENVMGASFPYLGRVIVASLILTLAIIALSFFFIIPGVIFAVFWAFTIYALVIEDVGLTQAFHHSRKVVTGRWWMVFGYLLLQGLIVLATSFMVLFPIILVIGLAGPFFGVLFNIPILATISIIIISLISIIAQMFILPFTFTFLERFYVNLRDETPDLYNIKRV